MVLGSSAWAHRWLKEKVAFLLYWMRQGSNQWTWKFKVCDLKNRGRWGQLAFCSHMLQSFGSSGVLNFRNFKAKTRTSYREFWRIWFNLIILFLCYCKSFDFQDVFELRYYSYKHVYRVYWLVRGAYLSWDILLFPIARDFLFVWCRG